MCNRPWEGVKRHVWFRLSWPTSNLPLTPSPTGTVIDIAMATNHSLYTYCPIWGQWLNMWPAFYAPKKSIAVAMTSRLNISDAEWEITVSCSGLRVGCLIILLDISGFWPHSLLFSDAGKMMNNKRNTMICFVSVPLSTDTPCFRKANVCQTSFI